MLTPFSSAFGFDSQYWINGVLDLLQGPHSALQLSPRTCDLAQSPGDHAWRATEVALAQEFCVNPHLTLCGLRDARNEEARAQIRRIREDARRHELAVQFRTQSGSPEDLKKLEPALSRGSLKRILKRSSQLEQGRLSEEIEALRATFEQVIQNEPGLTEERKQIYISRIRAVHWVNSSEILELLNRKGSLNSKEETLLQAITRACGSDGTGWNAFHFETHRPNWDHQSFGWDVGSQQSLVLCPGLTLGIGLARSSSQQEIRALVTSILGHELGHAIDIDSDPTGYDAHLSCLARQPSALELTSIDERDDLDGYIREATPRERIDSHANEIISDAWASRVLGRLLLEGKLGKTPSEMVNALHAGISPFCDSTGSDAVHPSGIYRINQIFGRDPNLRRAFHCTDGLSRETASEEASCLF